MPNFKFELIKMFRTKKIIIGVLVSILLSCSLFTWIYKNSDKYGYKLFSNMEYIRGEMHASRMNYRETMFDAGLTPEEITYHMTIFTEMENEMRAFDRIKDYDYKYEIPGQMIAFYEAYEKYAEDRTENYNGRQLFHLYGEWMDSHELEKKIESKKAFFKS